MEKLYAVREVAVILKVHEVTVRRWIAEKKNKYNKIKQTDQNRTIGN